MRIVFAFLSKPQSALAVCVVSSALLLACAHAFERFAGLPPCSLCLQQREAHWAVLAIGGCSLILWRLWKNRYIWTTGIAGSGLCYITSAILAGYHAGVEWAFWPGPAECTGATAPLRAMDVTSGFLKGAAALDTPSCTDAAWRLLGISMAGYNFLASIVLVGVLAYTAKRMLYPSPPV